MVMISMAPAVDFECPSSLYCAEDDDSLGFEDIDECYPSNLKENGCVVPDEIEHLWDAEELENLSEKQTQYLPHRKYIERLSDPSSVEASARREAVLWTLKVHMHYGFHPVTAILSICYLDRFLSATQLQHDKPWMAQLAAVACLSLAAKMEETEVPLLLDLQVEDAKFVFESKTIQRMELLVLSTLDWRMTSVTALSFLDHAPHILSSGNHSSNLCNFMRRCHDLLLTALADSKILGFLPSVVAMAVLLYALREQGHAVNEALLFSAIKADEAECEKCLQLLGSHETDYGEGNWVVGMKRKRIWEDAEQGGRSPGSPDAVLDACFSFSCSSGNSTPSSATQGASNPFSLCCLSDESEQVLPPFLISKKSKKEDGFSASLYDECCF